MMKTFRKIMRLAAVSGCFIPTLAWAQPEGGGFDQTQVITGDRTLSVQKAYKITDMPEPVQIDVEVGQQHYNLIPKRPATTVEVEPIEPAKVRVREPLEKLYHGYIRAGVGTFATPFVEGMYSSTRNRDVAYGIRVKHNSSNAGIKRDVAYSGFSENLIDAWGKKIFGKHSLSGDLGFNSNMWHYYGFDPQGLDFEKKDIRQRFNTINLGADWKSYYRDSSLVNHDIGLQIYHLNDLYDASEFGLNATGNLRSYRGEHFFTLDAGFDLISYKADRLESFDFVKDTFLLADDNTNAILHATPKVVLRKGGLRAEVGLGLYAQFSNKLQVHAFPDVDFSYSLFDDIFVPYAGITGGVKRTSFRTLTDENPFILSNVELENEIERYKIFGGIRGSVSDKISFNVGASYSKADEVALFVNDTLLSRENRFSVIYDGVNTFTLSGEVSYLNDEKWGATFRGEIFSYSTDREAEAWNMPDYRFSLQANYNLFDKLILRTDIAYVGPRKMKSLWPLPDHTQQGGGYWIADAPAYIDLSLGVEYRYTTRLSAFVEAYNLTASKYDIYYRFPAQRVFLRGGVKYAF